MFNITNGLRSNTTVWGGWVPCHLSSRDMLSHTPLKSEMRIEDIASNMQGVLHSALSSKDFGLRCSRPFLHFEQLHCSVAPAPAHIHANVKPAHNVPPSGNGMPWRGMGHAMLGGHGAYH